MEKILANLKTEFCKELYRRNYEYTDHAIDTIIDSWYEAKKPLIDLLSKHPNWNPEKFMIQFDSDFSRKIEVRDAKEFLSFLECRTDILGIVTYRDGGYFHRNLWDEMYCCMFHATYLGEADTTYLDHINTLSENFRFRPGMKVTKVMRKICEHFGWTEITGYEYNREGERVQFNAFEREYAKYCDAMCPLKVTRHTCISVNPLDYLLMSYGNSWRSCHYISNANDRPGEYSSGTISYMLDEHSIVFYTVDASYNGDSIELHEKTQRQIFGYNDFQIMQSRLYPQSNDSGAESIYEDFRNTMQKVIADCLEKPNLWVRRKHNLNTRHGDGATCYPDWNYGSDLYSTSVLKEKADVDLKAIVLGTAPICIECGYTHDVEDNINCCRGGRRYCTCCGERIRYEEDIRWVGDAPYCEDCVSWCNCCEEYVSEETTYIPSEDRYVCESCLSEYYIYCEHCDEYCHQDEMTFVESEDRWVCDHHLDMYYIKCAKCGEWILKLNANEADDGNYYCDECFEEMKEEDEDDE